MSTKVLNKLVNICATLSGDITFSTLIDLFYPVGSIYTSMNSTEPSELFEVHENKLLIASYIVLIQVVQQVVLQRFQQLFYLLILIRLVVLRILVQ